MNNDKLLISYLTLRKSVGGLGFALPIVLVAGTLFFGDCKGVQLSISGYYHTIMRDVFVGIVCAIALFLFAYNGYDKRDKIAAQLASFFAIGLALFPTSQVQPTPICNIASEPLPAFFGILHLLFAAAFFIVLAYFSLFLFTESDGKMTEEKKRRNTIYRFCGIIMVVCLILITIYFLLIEPELSQPEKYDVVFYLESIALWAFAASWLVKGEMFIADR